MLRSEAVIYRRHLAPRRERQRTADGVVRVQVTAEEAAAVEIHDERRRQLGLRPVPAHAHSGRYHAVLYRMDLWWLARERARAEVRSPRLFHRQRAARRQATLGFEKRLDLRIERHVRTLALPDT